MSDFPAASALFLSSKFEPVRFGFSASSAFLERWVRIAGASFSGGSIPMSPRAATNAVASSRAPSSARRHAGASSASGTPITASAPAARATTAATGSPSAFWSSGFAAAASLPVSHSAEAAA